MSTPTRPLTTAELFASSGGGAPLFFNRNTPPGTSVTGTVVESEPVQARDFESSELKFWDDGSPQMQLVVTLQTTLRDPGVEDDDGKRRLFVKWWGTDRNNLTAAVQKAGDQYVRVGATLTDTYIGEGVQKDRKLSAPKIHDYIYVPPATPTETLMSGNGNGVADALVAATRRAQTITAPPAAPVPVPPTPVETVAPAGQPLIRIDPASAITQIKTLAAAGLDVSTIHAAVPAFSLDAITAILNLPA